MLTARPDSGIVVDNNDQNMISELQYITKHRVRGVFEGFERNFEMIVLNPKEHLE